MVPGVMYNDALGPFATPLIRIRGLSSEKVGVYLDGIPVEDTYQKWGGVGHITTHGVSSIQVSKGFTSPTLGIAQMGGAVNIISAKPQKELEINLSQKLIYGRSTPDVDEIHQGISIGTNQGKFYFRIDASHEKRETYPYSYSWDGEGSFRYKTNPYVDMYSNNLKLKLGIMPNENHEYSLNYVSRQGSKKNMYNHAPIQIMDWPVYDQKFLYLLGNSFFTPDFSLNSRIYFTELEKTAKYYEPANPSAWSMMAGSSYSNTMGGIFTFSYDIYKDANAKFGVNVKRDYSKGSSSKYADLYTSGFAQYAQRLWDFRLIAALNYDWGYTLTRSGSSMRQQLEHSRGTFAQGLAAQAALYYDFIEGHSAHLMIGRKHDMPTMWRRNFTSLGSAVPNPTLAPETGILYEVGYDINLPSTTLNFAAYYHDLTDMLTTKYLYGADATCLAPITENEVTYCTQSTNAPEGYIYGVEMGVEQGFFENDMLVLGANYSYLHKKAKGASDDNSVAGTRITEYPNHMFNAKVAIKPIERLQILGFATLDSARYAVDTTTSSYTKDSNYFTIDLGAKYDFGKGFSLSFDVTNITDRDNVINSVYSGGTQIVGLHLVGRRYIVGFDYKY